MRFALLLAALAPAVALADQCAWISKGQATEAQGVVKGKKVIEWCEPCGDGAPKSATRARKVTRAEVKPTEDKYFELQVNGKGVDLAYLYVEVSRGRYKNVAKIVGCETTGVQAELTLPAD